MSVTSKSHLIKKVKVPDRINLYPDGRKVVSAKQVTMLTLLGNPNPNLDGSCGKLTNPSIKALIVTSSVGPFRVTGLRPAVESLSQVMDEIREKQREVYDALGSAGMLCVRHVRGVPSSISNHSWGIAIDVTIAGELDPYKDGPVQFGLTLIAPIFAKHGWFWGAAFDREDGMHFECGDGLIREWAADGKFGVNASSPPEAHMLSIGDRGDEVRLLQETLNLVGAGLLADKVFGRETQAAVMRFQVSRGLGATGVVDRTTWAELRKVRADADMPTSDGAAIAAHASDTAKAVV